MSILNGSTPSPSNPPVPSPVPRRLAGHPFRPRGARHRQDPPRGHAADPPLHQLRLRRAGRVRQVRLHPHGESHPRPHRRRHRRPGGWVRSGRHLFGNVGDQRDHQASVLGRPPDGAARLLRRQLPPLRRRSTSGQLPRRVRRPVGSRGAEPGAPAASAGHLDRDPPAIPTCASPTSRPGLRSHATSGPSASPTTPSCRPSTSVRSNTGPIWWSTRPRSS